MTIDHVRRSWPNRNRQYLYRCACGALAGEGGMVAHLQTVHGWQEERAEAALERARQQWEKEQGRV